jgi:multimeric flavodoxin WrbA
MNWIIKLEHTIMKITVLNGSPKGQASVTVQYVHFLQLKFPDVEFKILDVAQKIKKLEEDKEAFQNVIEEVSTSDAVLWAFPLYYLLVSSQYKRFIELIHKRESIFAFRGKPAAVLSTSINYFDHTAHNYMNAICDDLQMKFMDFYSAEMNDLLKPRERQRLKLFGEAFILAIKEGAPAIRNNSPLIASTFAYQPRALKQVETYGKKVLIVADDIDQNTNLRFMVENLQKTFLPAAELVQIKDVDIKGGCLGCVQCGMDNSCIYHGKDGFIDFFEQKVKTADILFFAGAIHDRYLSALWKCFFDRGFFNGHIPVLEGKQIGFIISGPFGQIHNLREILEAYVGSQRSNLVGFVSDDPGNSEEISEALQTLANRSILYGKLGYFKPPTFLQVGGKKLFRDAVWGRLRPVFQADHRYFKKHGYYNFPQKKYKWRLINNILILLTKIPPFRREFVRRTKSEMIRPFADTLEDISDRDAATAKPIAKG